MRSISPRLFTFACVMLIWALWSLAAESPGETDGSAAAGYAQAAAQSIEHDIDVVE
ncbi:hypothetical protein [Woeseia oceani]|uniref:hypothetical protein n=1 Tax=Woeseia oceani TaxID=1548547 RepID=UPI0012E9FC8A|nr:hypothetical protein [Woeseia oceani]